MTAIHTESGPELEAPGEGVFFVDELSAANGSASLMHDRNLALLYMGECALSSANGSDSLPGLNGADHLSTNPDQLDEILVATEGSLIVVMPSSPALRKFSRTSRLDTFALEDSDTTTAFAIPIDSITGRSVTGTGDQGDATLWVRVKTEADPPHLVHDITQPNRIREEASQGLWHPLPLNHTQISLA